MLTIGELSKISQVTVKSIRYYQELELLKPVKIDPITNYRYFNRDSYDRLSAILTLKELGFTLTEIKEILRQCNSEMDLKDFIHKKIEEVRSRVKKLKDMESRLKKFNDGIDESSPDINEDIVEFELDIPHYAAVKIDGTYEDVGNGYRLIYKHAGRYVKGSGYSFYYDMEYKEEKPNFEAVLELNKKLTGKGFRVSSIKKKAVKLIYKGAYGGQGETYYRLFQYCRERGYEVELPIIEKYIKGPGFIFKGNTKNYITECILLYTHQPKVEESLIS